MKTVEQVYIDEITQKARMWERAYGVPIEITTTARMKHYSAIRARSAIGESFLREEFETPQVRDQQSNPRFKQWFGNSVVKQGDQPRIVYHGTLGEFDSFDLKGASKQSWVGRGFYFSSSLPDVEHNYATPDGPDFNSKIQREVNSIFEMINTNITKFVTDILPWNIKNGEKIDPIVIERLEHAYAKQDEIRQLLHREMGISELEAIGFSRDILRRFIKNYLIHQEKGLGMGAIMPCYLRIENPCYMGFRENSTQFEGSSEILRIVDNLIGKYYSQKLKMSNSMFYQENEPFSVDELHQQFINAGNPNEHWSSNDLFAATLRELGFDGVIMDAWETFPGMNNIKDAIHYIVWKPGQIKSAIGNKGTYNVDNPKITEAKNYGNLYHGTSVRGFLGILKDKGLRFTTSISKIALPSKHYNKNLDPRSEVSMISFSRNHKIDDTFWGRRREFTIILEFDGARMSNHIHLEPFLYGGSKHGAKARNTAPYPNGEDVRGENEERVFGQRGKLLRCLPFLKRVIVREDMSVRGNNTELVDLVRAVGLQDKMEYVSQIMSPRFKNAFKDRLAQLVAEYLGKSVPIELADSGGHQRKKDLVTKKAVSAWKSLEDEKKARAAENQELGIQEALDYDEGDETLPGDEDDSLEESSSRIYRLGLL